MLYLVVFFFVVIIVAVFFPNLLITSKQYHPCEMFSLKDSKALKGLRIPT